MEGAEREIGRISNKGILKIEKKYNLLISDHKKGKIIDNISIVYLIYRASFMGNPVLEQHLYLFVSHPNVLNSNLLGRNTYLKGCVLEIGRFSFAKYLAFLGATT